MSPVRRICRLFLFLTGGFLVGCGTAQDEPANEAAFIAEIRQWHQQRIEGLQQPDSWLTLAGLYWLEEGANRFGSAPDNDLVFPEQVPPYLGTFHLEEGVVRMAAAPGVDITYNGEPVHDIVMDPGGETADVILAWGTLRWFLIERDHGLAIRLRDHEHPALSTFTGTETYPIDLAWRLHARFEPYAPPRTALIPTVMGSETAMTVPGAAVFEVDDDVYRLDVTGEPGDSAFFVIFGDRTNGQETYGGGRYLWVQAPRPDGSMIVDFNKAYNPPCVFSPYATCPLPPPQNRLPLYIEAGEKEWISGSGFKDSGSGLDQKHPKP